MTAYQNIGTETLNVISPVGFAEIWGSRFAIG